jgi:hypothetical protein
MKARSVVLLYTLAVFAGQTASAQDTSVNIPLRAGQFSNVTTGSLAICLNATLTVEVACTSKGAVAFPLTVLNIGNGTGDAQGNLCISSVETDTSIPPNIFPPIVTPNEHTVGKITDYDPHTGTGDDTFTGYAGGHCNGASFVKDGATKLSSGTGHFVVSENGNRVDGLATKLTNPIGSIGDFSLYTVSRALVPGNP